MNRKKCRQEEKGSDGRRWNGKEEGKSSAPCSLSSLHSRLTQVAPVEEEEEEDWIPFCLLTTRIPEPPHSLSSTAAKIVAEGGVGGVWTLFSGSPPPPPCVQYEEVSHGSLPTSLLFGLPLHTLAETTAFFRWKMTMILATNDDCYRGGEGGAPSFYL